MSVTASNWAWEQATESSGQRLVLLALADACGGDEDDPQICWPSIGRVSRRVGIGESTVKLHLERLAVIGLVTKVERRRRKDGTMGTWTITVNFLSRADPSAVDASTTADPSAVDHSRPIGSHEPSSSEPSVEILCASGFDSFWALYPRKQDRKTAATVWKNMTRTNQDAAWLALPDWLAYWVARRDPTFIPYPTTWLRGERWNDAIPDLPHAKRTTGINGLGLSPDMVDQIRNTPIPTRAELEALDDAHHAQLELNP